MTLVPTPRVDKHCFVYCGDDRCNCIAGQYHKQNGNREWNNKYTADFKEECPDSDNESTPFASKT